MDVADPRFGSRARDPDQLALQIESVFKKFLEEYRSKYSKEALLLLSEDRNTLFIDFKDVEMFDSNMAEDIIVEYYRFYQYLCRALASFVREERISQAESSMDPNAEVSERVRVREALKKDLDRDQIINKDYYIGFYNFAHQDNVRDLSSTKIGSLTRVSGQVVRAHIVHPELLVGCFRCKDCLTEQYVRQQFRYTEPPFCANDNCANRTRYSLILDKSQFTDFQRLRIQETQQELPRGCIPRSFDVIIRGSDQMECIQPGDQCDFVGTLIATPDVGQLMNGIVGTVSNEVGQDSGISGLKGLGVREMSHSLAFLANSCTIEGRTLPSINTDADNRDTAYGTTLNVDDFSKEEIRKIEEMSKDPKLLDNLSESLFSSIYGSEDVKRGIILQLLGGVPKRTSTGTKLRGDINICLVGDPSTAKSQFLKIVTDFAPVKAVYASGKASSASGLTAAVIRDADGGFVIEAGALMLADRGICCIDEFDKMDLKDQVALHEAMEQQTISITKAGVSATLNARASILAAANPVFGCYNPSFDLRRNLNFSLPIMSRFDLFFVIVDPHERQNDRLIASKIIDMHHNYANCKKPNFDNMKYTFEEIRLYLRFARKYYPKIPIESEKVFVREYLRMRSETTKTRTAWRTTVRQFEALIRLSEAIARAHCSEIVKPDYIKMAADLIEKTIVHVGKSEIELPDKLSQPEDEVQMKDEQSQGMYEGEVESQPIGATQVSQRSVKMSLSEYKGMADVFLMKLRIEAETPDRDNPAMRRSELVDWYLHQCVGEIATEGDLIMKKQLCERVLDRLIKKDQILMQIRDDGDIVDPSEEEPSTEDDFMILINPLEDTENFLDQVNA